MDLKLEVVVVPVSDTYQGLHLIPGDAERVPGLHPERLSYASFASFQDPDGNQWFLQEVSQRALGR